MSIYKYTSIKSEVKSTVLGRLALAYQGSYRFLRSNFSETIQKFS